MNETEGTRSDAHVLCLLILGAATIEAIAKLGHDDLAGCLAVAAGGSVTACIVAAGCVLLARLLRL